MPTYCSVPGCQGRGGFSFPSDKVLQQKWCVAIRRADEKGGMWHPTERSLVCKAHFKESDIVSAHVQDYGQRKKRRLVEGSVPSIFSFRPNREQTPRSIRAMRRKATVKTTPAEIAAATGRAPDSELPTSVLDHGSRPLTTQDSSSEEDVQVEQHEEEAEESEEEPEVLSEEESQVLSGNADFVMEIEVQDEQTENNGENAMEEMSVSVKSKAVGVQTKDTGSLSAMQCFGIEALQDDPDMIRFYTSFRDYGHFKFFLHCLGPAAHDLKYKSKLEVEDELFLTLIKLRLNKEDEELAFFFKVSKPTVGRIFHTWLNFLFYQLKDLDLWPSREVIDAHMPFDFKKKFPSTRVIIDGTEIPIERPGSVQAQQATWSSYKNKNTLKVLVGISPHGAVTFVSHAYGGSASDRQIVERSDLLAKKDMFDRGDSIMADKGFIVQDLFCSKGVYVNMPTFLKGVNQLPAVKVANDQKISSKRVHVERVIGAAKTFKILSQRLTHHYRKLGGKILFVSLVIHNFRPSIVD